MALSWNVEEVENHETVCFEMRKPNPSEGKVETDENGEARYLRPLTEMLIFSTISVGIGRITEKNAAEFYARLRLMEQIDGPFLRTSDGEDRRVTPEDVQSHIGLTCNVAEESRRTFYTKIGRDLDRFKASYTRKTTEEATA
jgi:hypothetical protein